MIPVPVPILETLAARFGTTPKGLSHLGGGDESSDGIAYSFTQAGQDRVLKIMALPSHDPDGLLRIQERLDFVHFLGEHEVDMVFPLPGKDGKLIASEPAGDQIFIAYSMEKKDGEHPKQELDEESFVLRFGRLIGKLHRITKLYPTWRHSPTLGKGGIPILGWEQEWQDFYDWGQDEEVKERWLTIRQRLEKLPIDRDCFGFIHNDPHAENILVCDDRLTLLDFDVANYHWFITDISIALQSTLFSNNAGGMVGAVTDPQRLRLFLKRLMDGYRSENDLADSWLEQLDLFISYRRILLFTVNQGWLSENPGLRKQWKDMILKEPPVIYGSGFSQ